MVRFEDLIFRADEVIPQVCQCVLGNSYRQPSKFLHFRGAAKDHGGGQGGLLDSIIKYGNQTKRAQGYTQNQWNAANEVIGQDLMNRFGYLQSRI